MQFSDGRIIRMWKAVDCRQESAEQEIAADGVPAGFYFAMPWTSKRKRRKSPAVRSVKMYGPFAASHIARIIETSAREFGLLPVLESVDAARPQAVRDHLRVLQETTEAREPARKALVLPLTARG